MNTETTPLGQYLLRRQAASLDYVGSSVYIAPIGCEQSAFFAGWDAAMEYANETLSEGIGRLDSDETREVHGPSRR